MSSWQKKTLGEFVSLQRGHDLTDIERRPGNVPVVGSAGHNGYHDTALARGPGIVIGRSGASFGQVHYCVDDYWPHNTGLYVTDFHGNDPLFAYYYLKNIDFNRYNSGSAQPSLNRNFIYPIEVTVPCAKDQRAIARTLGTLDGKIALNRQINQTLEHIAQALFKSWFVDFEPVKAKMAAIAAGESQHGITRAAMRAISGKTDAELDKLQSKHSDRYQELQSVAELFPDSMNATGEIPSGWSESIIGDEVSIVGGGTPSTACPEYWNGEFAWVTPKDLSGVTEKILLDSERKITQAGVKKISSGQLPIGSVLLSSRAPIGYLALTMIPASINQGFIAMVCDKQLPNTYVLQWAEQNLEEIKQRGSGTTFAELSKTAFRTMKIIKPNALLLDAFNRQALPLYEKMAALACESKSLSCIRDLLLPKLLSGEIVLEAGEEKNG